MTDRKKVKHVLKLSFPVSIDTEDSDGVVIEETDAVVLFVQFPDEAAENDAAGAAFDTLYHVAQAQIDKVKPGWKCDDSPDILSRIALKDVPKCETVIRV
jgi:hypothetical protein